ncbi:MAG: metallophosphoesterase [Dysgonomonas sp.]
MPPSIIGRIILIAFAVISVSSIFVYFLLGEYLPVGVTTVFHNIGLSWFFIFLYFLMLALLKDFIRILHIVPSGTFNHYTRDNWAGLILAVGFVAMLMVCGYLKYNWKVRMDIPVTIEKKIDKKDSLRIVAISDMHLGYGIGKKELLQWIDLINKENPDIVLIAGDIIDNSVRPLRENRLEQYFKNIKAPIYTCLGNHEYISGLNESIRFIEDAGINLLRDNAVLVDSSFYVIGRDDKTNPDRKPLSELVNGIDKTKPVILLDHQPYNLEEAEQNGIDLQFSGHTHSGQVWPISLITDMIYEDSHGYKKKGNTNVYVSSGIGIWGGKFRIGTQSEYIVFNIKTAQ